MEALLDRNAAACVAISSSPDHELDSDSEVSLPEEAEDDDCLERSSEKLVCGCGMCTPFEVRTAFNVSNIVSLLKDTDRAIVLGRAAAATGDASSATGGAACCTSAGAVLGGVRGSIAAVPFVFSDMTVVSAFAAGFVSCTSASPSACSGLICCTGDADLDVHWSSLCTSSEESRPPDEPWPRMRELEYVICAGWVSSCCKDDRSALRSMVFSAVSIAICNHEGCEPMASAKCVLHSDFRHGIALRRIDGLVGALQYVSVI